MTEYSYLTPSFKSGQIGNLLSRKSGLRVHQNGLSTILNMQSIPEGGVISRAGTQFIAPAKNKNTKVRLIPFEFSLTDVYVVEMGPSYMRFHNDGSVITESDLTITGITQADPAVVTSASHGLSAGDHVYITGVVGMTEVNNSRLPYVVGTTTTNTFELEDRDGNNIDSSAFTAYSSGGVANRIYEISSPYAEADLFDIEFEQSLDVITLVHEEYAPRNLTRTSDTSWTLTALMKDGDDASATNTFVDGPYLAENTETTTLDPDSTGTTPTITASATTGINEGQGFLSTDVGRLLRWHDGTDFFYYEITAVNSTTEIDATRLSSTAPSGHVGTTRWRLGSFSETTGFPRAITYHQERRVYAGTVTEPDTVFGSAIDDYTNFTPGTDDDEAYKHTLQARSLNTIFWLASHSRLRIGTNNGPWSLYGASDDESITPTNKEADFEDRARCKRLRPVHLGNETIYAQRSGKIVRLLSYDFSRDGLGTLNITVTDDSILGNPGDSTDEGVVQMDYQLEQHPTVWCVRDDGKLASLAFDTAEELSAWALHELGGTNTVVESVAVVPETGEDRVYVSVSRTIDGVTDRYIERLASYFRGSDVSEAVFCDSSITFTGETPAATLTPGATTGDSITFTAGSSVFASTDVGRIIQSGSSRAEITAYTSGTEVTANILVDFSSTSAIASGSWTLSNTTVSNLEHLEGQTVTAIVDGGEHPAVTVTDGAVTLDSQYTYVTVGLPYTRTITTLDIDFGAVRGSSYGYENKIEKVTVDFFETVGGSVGTESGNVTELLFRDGESTMNLGVPLFTGTKEIRPKGGWRDTKTITITKTDPLPMTINTMVIKGEVSEVP